MKDSVNLNEDCVTLLECVPLITRREGAEEGKIKQGRTRYARKGTDFLAVMMVP